MDIEKLKADEKAIEEALKQLDQDLHADDPIVDPLPPADPIVPTDPGVPVEPQPPADPVDPVTPEEPAPPADPVPASPDPEVPSEPAPPADPVDPVKPEEPAAPADPVPPVFELPALAAASSVFPLDGVVIQAAQYPAYQAQMKALLDAKMAECQAVYQAQVGLLGL